jgi:hypothetical protein
MRLIDGEPKATFVICCEISFIGRAWGDLIHSEFFNLKWNGSLWPLK